ncbi:MAG: hypothetical protein K2X47_07120, partial [Bdellovibrionales bacterium]|nr:hypothetical protein [Bdellovibrionales bacterium]
MAPTMSLTYPFSIPDLRYDYSALEPYLDRATLEIHHSKHHAGYVQKLNDAIRDEPLLHNLTIEEILRGIDKVPAKIRQVVIDQGGGHANHQFFWKILSPSDQSPREPSGEL